MNKRNAVVKLGRTQSHRKAMMRNMVTSLFEHERITTTRAKGKALRSHAEVLITRARYSLTQQDNPHAVLHNKRILLRHLTNRNIVKKLLEDIAPRFVDRPGGYLRMIHLPERKSDAAPMSIVELVDRREKAKHVHSQGDKSKAKNKGQDSIAKPTGDTVQDTSKKGKEDGKWYSRFTRKRKEWD